VKIMGMGSGLDELMEGGCAVERLRYNTHAVDDGRGKIVLVEGTKHDQGKPRWDLLPFDAVEEVVKVYTFGATKYDAWNWTKGIKYSRIAAAMFRHWVKWWWRGLVNDEETKCHHLASVIWCGLALLHYELNKERFKEFDDRRL